MKDIQFFIESPNYISQRRAECAKPIYTVSLHLPFCMNVHSYISASLAALSVCTAGYVIHTPLCASRLSLCAGAYRRVDVPVQWARIRTYVYVSPDTRTSHFFLSSLHTFRRGFAAFSTASPTRIPSFCFFSFLHRARQLADLVAHAALPLRSVELSPHSNNDAKNNKIHRFKSLVVSCLKARERGGSKLNEPSEAMLYAVSTPSIPPPTLCLSYFQTHSLSCPHSLFSPSFFFIIFQDDGRPVDATNSAT